MSLEEMLSAVEACLEERSRLAREIPALSAQMERAQELQLQCMREEQDASSELERVSARNRGITALREAGAAQRQLQVDQEALRQLDAQLNAYAVELRHLSLEQEKTIKACDQVIPRLKRIAELSLGASTANTQVSQMEAKKRDAESTKRDLDQYIERIYDALSGQDGQPVLVRRL